MRGRRCPHRGSRAWGRPLFAVCTNGRRDRCCAITGRRIAEDLHAEFGSAVVEISHLGGHRFAGTMVVLPWGYAYGYLDSAAALQVARAAADGLVHPGGLRGRADRTPIAQAAEAILRTEIGPHPPAAIGVITEISEPGGVGEPALLRARVFGQWQDIALCRVVGPTVTATECGGKPFTTGHWRRA